MRRPTGLWFGLGIAGFAILAGVLLIWFRPSPGPSQTTASTAAPAATPGSPPGTERRIKATIFYGSPDGLHLVGVEREVPLEPTTAEQARRVIEAALQEPPAPLSRIVPAETKLNALYVSQRGEAFLDFSSDITTAHPGGSLSELLTVYGLVDTLTSTLPAITAVQILVDGREVDTLAGHVDLRHPLEKNLRWVAGSEEGETGTQPEEGDQR